VRSKRINRTAINDMVGESVSSFPFPVFIRALDKSRAHSLNPLKRVKIQKMIFKKEGKLFKLSF
jgi:hypothetical protein